METSRDDVGIAFRSALLSKGSKQRFSLFGLVILSILFIFAESTEFKQFNYLRSFIKDSIYRGSIIVSTPSKAFSNISKNASEHINLYGNYKKLKLENDKLKNSSSKLKFLELENTQLRNLIDEQEAKTANFVSARVMIDKQGPYLNSFIINIGSNKNLKNGMAVLDGSNFIGRIVDVNFFSSRILLVSDLNSKIPVIIEPSANHAILSGHGDSDATLEYLPEMHKLQNGDKVFTSGKEGIFNVGIPIGEVKIEKNVIKVLLFSDLSQISFVNININKKDDK